MSGVGDELSVEGMSEVEAEVVVLDSQGTGSK